METRAIVDKYFSAHVASAHAHDACAVVDISAKAIVTQCEFLMRQILQVFIYSETVSVSLAVCVHI